MTDLCPELTIACPECGAPRGEYCISRRAIAIHLARKRALEELEREATRLLGRSKRQ